MAESEAKTTITIPVALARIIDGAFLPANPNKMRSASKETIEAAKEFKRLLAAAGAVSNG